LHIHHRNKLLITQSKLITADDGNNKDIPVSFKSKHYFENAT